MLTKSDANVIEKGGNHGDQPRGKMVQDAFPQLSADEQEFILTGITAAEWNEAFKSP